jgi:hypothetical protein
MPAFRSGEIGGHDLISPEIGIVYPDLFHGDLRINKISKIEENVTLSLLVALSLSKGACACHPDGSILRYTQDRLSSP